MFGDSVQSSPVSTLGRSGGGSLASLYQARKANDSATVEQIKQQFQKQIEQMMQASQRHDTRHVPLAPPPQFRSRRYIKENAYNDKTKPYFVTHLRTLPIQLMKLQLSTSNEMKDQLLLGPIR